MQKTWGASDGQHCSLLLGKPRQLFSKFYWILSFQARLSSFGQMTTSPVEDRPSFVTAVRDYLEKMISPAHCVSTHGRFTLMRDTGVDGNVLEMSAAATAEATSTTTIASYKGREFSCEIAGLTPNTLYCFRMRAANARTRSSFSAPLEVNTASRNDCTF